MKVNFEFASEKLEERLSTYSKQLAERAAPTASLYGARIFYKEIQLEVPRSVKGHYFSIRGSKRHWFEPGSLAKAMYIGFDYKKSTDKTKVYKIGWVHKEAPYGYMVARGTKLESGGARSPANPFMRRSYAQAQHEAKKAAVARFMEVAKEVLDGR